MITLLHNSDNAHFIKYNYHDHVVSHIITYLDNYIVNVILSVGNRHDDSLNGS